MTKENVRAQDSGTCTIIFLDLYKNYLFEVSFLFGSKGNYHSFLSLISYLRHCVLAIIYILAGNCSKLKRNSCDRQFLIFLISLFIYWLGRYELIIRFSSEKFSRKGRTDGLYFIFISKIISK